MTNANATRDQILRAFVDLIQATDTNDEIVFFYSGIGFRKQGRDRKIEKAILPYDCLVSGKVVNLVTDYEIENFLSELAKKTNAITVVFDSCYSGSVETSDANEKRTDSIIRPSSMTGPLVGEPAWTAADYPPAAGTSHPQRPAYTFVASCRDDETAYEFRAPGTGVIHGAFTYYLFLELEKSGPGATLRHVFEAVQKSLASQFPNQHPMLFSQVVFKTNEHTPLGLLEAIEAVTSELFSYLKAHPHELHQLKPRQFEQLIAEILASYGWQVQLTSATRDGGYDIFAISRDRAGVNTSWIVECKKYREDRKVGIDIVRALYGVRAVFPAANLMLATTSHFSKDVRQLKESRYDLELRDYEGILEWIDEYKPNPDGRLYINENQLKEA